MVQVGGTGVADGGAPHRQVGDRDGNVVQMGRCGRIRVAVAVGQSSAEVGA